MSWLGDAFGSIIDIGKSLVGVIPGVGDVAKGIVGAVVDPITNALGISPEKQAQRDARDFQMDMLSNQQSFAAAQAKQAHDWNVEDWERNNAYNSPAAQKQRLQEAGLNPLLAETGSGLSSAITSTPPPSPSLPSSDLSAFASLISAKSSAELAKSQARLNDVEAEKVATDNELAKEDLKTRGETNQATLDNLRANKNLTESQIEKISFEIDQIQRENDYIIEQTRGEKQKNDFTEETWDIAISRLVAEVNCTRAQADSYLASAVASRSVAELNEVTTRFANDTYEDRRYQENQKGRQEYYKSLGFYWDNESKAIKVGIDRDFAEVDKALGIAGKATKVVKFLISDK